jgi:hypothetical protein
MCAKIGESESLLVTFFISMHRKYYRVGIPLKNGQMMGIIVQCKIEREREDWRSRPKLKQWDYWTI